MKNLKNSLLLLLAAVIVSALAVVPAHAQSGRISANVPFDFVVDKTTLKAGTYAVKTDGDFLAIVSESGKTVYTLPLTGDSRDVHGGEPYLVFARYGNESFLTRVVFSESNTRRLAPNSREKEMMARTSGDTVNVHSGAGQ